MPENTATDWSTIVAIIALTVSLAGTIISPVINSIINNRHQRKMFQLSEKAALDKENQQILINCISSIGAACAQPTDENMEAFGKFFHRVYAIAPVEKWDMLDNFYDKFVLLPFDNKLEKSELTDVIHFLAGLLKELSQ